MSISSRISWLVLNSLSLMGAKEGEEEVRKAPGKMQARGGHLTRQVRGATIKADIPFRHGDRWGAVHQSESQALRLSTQA